MQIYENNSSTFPQKSDKMPSFPPGCGWNMAKIAKMSCFGPQTLLQFTKNHYLCPGLHQWYVSHASIRKNPEGLLRSAALSSRLIRPSAQSSPVSNPPGEDFLLHEPIFVAPPITEIPDYVWAPRYNRPSWIPGRPIKKEKDTAFCVYEEGKVVERHVVR